MSHGQARVRALLSGKGKGREERKSEGLEALKGAGASLSPQDALAGASCPNSCKIFFPALPPRGAPQPVQGCIRALCKELLGGGVGRAVAGAKREHGKAGLSSRSCATSDWVLAAPPWL